MQNKYSILINTCDNFEDCWIPFFKLFTVYWPDFEGTIYLNTEYKDFSYPGLDIVCTKVCEVNKIPHNVRATWSQCLRWALEAIDTDIVLYMQEDYFLNGSVKTVWVNHFFDLINTNSNIPCIQLTQAGIPALEKSKYDKLFTSTPDYFSYVSCQASFWRKGVMTSIIRDHETAWNFEWWGSKRAKYMGYEFLVLDPNFFSPNESIFPYVLTGVVGGRWYREVVALFKKHEINIDYSKRGFLEENTKPTISKRIKTKLSIYKLQSVIEIIKIKYFLK
ncbi:hypothetical protein [Flavobacterium sp. WC2509]|uniref:hypothetical protein n=1 Tax=Flavobacterium sp. WC2509 TaxID=3461406 RepID=UPI004043A8A4